MSTLTSFGDRVDDDEVGDAVAGEVGHRDRVRARRGGVRHLGAERAITRAQSHSHVPAHVVGIDQVGDAVAGEVGHRHAGGSGEAWALVGGVDSRRLERAVAVAQSHRDRVVGVVGEDQVGDAVAVDVRHRHLARAGAGGDDDLRLKRAVTVVQQDADRVVALVDVRMSSLPSLVTSASVTCHTRGPTA